MTTFISTSKPYKGMGMEGAVAKWYAGLTKKSLADFIALARRVSQDLPVGSRILEIAPGPGYFAIELAKRGNYDIVGLDISKTFVELARANATDANVSVDFRQGDAAKMPFANEAFDFLVCRAAFKNFSQPVRVLEDMHRVLKRGGRALIIDLRRDASMESINQAVSEMKLGTVNAFITRNTFRFMLLRRAYTKAELERMIAQTGFRQSEICENPIGLEVSLIR